MLTQTPSDDKHRSPSEGFLSMENIVEAFSSQKSFNRPSLYRRLYGRLPNIEDFPESYILNIASLFILQTFWRSSLNRIPFVGFLQSEHLGVFCRFYTYFCGSPISRKPSEFLLGVFYTFTTLWRSYIRRIPS